MSEDTCAETMSEHTCAKTEDTCAETMSEDTFAETMSEDTCAKTMSENTYAETMSEDTCAETMSENTSAETMSENTSAETMSQDTCAICLYEPRDPILLPCGNNHIFCLSCVGEIASHCGNSTSFLCPCCRNLVHIPPEGVSAFGARTSAEADTERKPLTKLGAKRRPSARASASCRLSTRLSAGRRPSAIRPSAGSRPQAIRPSAGSRPQAIRPSAGSRPQAIRPSAGSRPQARAATKRNPKARAGTVNRAFRTIKINSGRQERLPSTGHLILFVALLPIICVPCLAFNLCRKLLLHTRSSIVTKIAGLSKRFFSPFKRNGKSLRRS